MQQQAESVEERLQRQRQQQQQQQEAETQVEITYQQRSSKRAAAHAAARSRSGSSSSRSNKWQQPSAADQNCQIRKRLGSTRDRVPYPATRLANPATPQSLPSWAGSGATAARAPGHSAGVGDHQNTPTLYLTPVHVGHRLSVYNLPVIHGRVIHGI